jgi:hypothetical protein
VRSPIDELAALTRKPLDSAEARAMIAALRHAAEDATAAILGASLIDEVLTEAILSRLVDLNADQRKEFIKAALPTLSVKALIARSLGLFDGDTKHDLTVIGLIRNAFAHGSPRLSFDTPEIAQACDTLNWLRAKDLFKEKLSTPREKFSFAVRTILYGLLVQRGEPIKPSLTFASVEAMMIKIRENSAVAATSKEK